MRIALVISGVVAILTLVFAVMNPVSVQVKFPFLTLDEVSLPLLLVTTFFLGVLVGYLAWLPTRIRARSRVRTLERTAAAEQSVQTGNDDEESVSLDPDRDVSAS